MTVPYGDVVRSRVVMLVVLAVLAAACAGDGGDDEAQVEQPTTEQPAAEETPPEQAPGAFEVVPPEDVGLDPAVLADMAADAEADGSSCLLVLRDGKVAGEWYWNGGGPETPQEVFSVTKSVTSILVGIAQEDAVLDVDDPATTWIPEWEGTSSEEVTVEHLLSNDSGRHWTFQSDYSALVTAEDRTAYAIGLGQDAPPGTTWAYNNSAIQTLEQVLERSTGQSVPDFAQDRLLGPLGMEHSSITTDPAGNGNTFMGLQSTCPDLARFGWMVVHGGSWGDEQIVPEDWIEASTGAPSQELNAGYGYLWWLNREGPQPSGASPTDISAIDAVPRGQLVPDAPEELVWALGLGSQTVQVHEETRTVLVRLGPLTLDSPYSRADAARLVTEAIIDP